MDIKLPNEIQNEKYAVLLDFFLKGDSESVFGYFENLSEKERRSYAPALIACFKAVYKQWWDEFLIDGAFISPFGKPVREVLDAVEVAFLFSGSGSELVPAAKDIRSNRFLEKILLLRRPDWAVDYLEAWASAIEDTDKTVDPRRIYHSILHEGICGHSKSDIWAHSMFAIMSDSRYAGRPLEYLLENIEKEESEGFFETEFWQIFEVTSFPRNWCYTTHDLKHQWKTAIVLMIEQGKISREKILDACFSALERGFSEHHSKWFVQVLERIHDTFELSPEQEKRYLELLRSDNSFGRSLGLKVLEKNLKSKDFDPGDVLQSLDLLLGIDPKSKATKTLSVLDKIVQKHPEKRKDAFQPLLAGLLHESPEIGTASLEQLLKYDAFSDSGIMEFVQKSAPSLAPSVRAKFPGLKDEPIPDDSPQFNVSGQPVHRELLPIADFDELLDTCVKILENPNDPDEIERMIDGICRLGNDKPTDFTQKTDALKKRVFKIFGSSKTKENGKSRRILEILPFMGKSIAWDCIGLIAAWLCGEIPELRKYKIVLGDETWHAFRYSYGKQSILPFFSRRMKTLSEAVTAGKSFRPLGFPTHSGGWIDPIVFVERLSNMLENKEEFDETEKILAIFRLGTENRETALKKLDSLQVKSNEYIDAVRYALGGKLKKTGTSPHFWIAASRAVKPFEDDPIIEKAFPDYGPIGAKATRYLMRKKNGKLCVCENFGTESKKLDTVLFPGIALYSALTDIDVDNNRVNIWGLSLWPGNPEPALSAAIELHSWYHDEMYDSSFGAYIEFLAQPDIMIGKAGIVAIFQGLSSKRSEFQTAATDVLIDLPRSNRTSPSDISETLQELLKLKFFTSNRWLKAFKIVSEESMIHARFVLEILEGTVPSLDSKRISGFLELMLEISVSLGTGISSESCRKFLANLKGTGKAAKLAGKLLAIG